MNRSPRAILVALTATAAIGLTGCSQIEGLFGGDEPERSEDGDVTETTEGVSVLHLQQGDCTGELSESEVTEVDVIPCDEAHVNEVYHAYDIEGDEFPGDDQVNEGAVEACSAEFEPFVGVGYNDSDLEVNYLVPTQESWDGDDDRSVLCFVYDPQGDSTGSLEGAAR